MKAQVEDRAVFEVRTILEVLIDLVDPLKVAPKKLHAGELAILQRALQIVNGRLLYPHAVTCCHRKKIDAPVGLGKIVGSCSVEEGKNIPLRDAGITTGVITILARCRYD